MSTKAGNPYGKEPDEKDIKLEQESQETTNKSVKETDAEAHKTSENTRELEKEQHDKDKKDLNETQNANYAVGGGQYGRINNRDYGTTLRLAREADRYNSRPQEHVLHNGHWRGSGIQDLGTGYDKPKLETQETHAMNQAFQLDTNQKQLAQALQDAVNHKDLEAFQMAYKQLYGIELDRMEAAIKMRQLSRQMELQQMFTKNMDKFQAYFQRSFGADTAATLYNLMETNPLYAKMLGEVILDGTIPPEYAEQLATDFMNDYYNNHKASMGDFEAMEAAINKVSQVLQQYNVQAEYITKWTNSWLHGKGSIRKSTKEMYNED